MLYYQVQIVLADSYGQWRRPFDGKLKSLRPAVTVREAYTDGELRRYIRDSARFYGVQPKWSSFKDRSGRTIEKCTFEWMGLDPLSRRRRTTETIWIHKGYDRY